MENVDSINRYLLLDLSRTPCTKKGLLEIEPVLLPEGKLITGNNSHFGWPIATRTQDTIIVLFHRNPENPDYRWSEIKRFPPDQFTSSALITRSIDGGHSWSEPFSLTSLIFKQTSHCRSALPNAIGTLNDGTVIVVTQYGVFRSPDSGLTWDHLPGAFGSKQLPGRTAGNGPQIINHPRLGLTVTGHGVGSVVNRDGTEAIDDEIWIRHSHDKGEQWQEIHVPLPSFVKPAEPATLYHDGAMYILGRCHGGGYHGASGTHRYVQLVAKNGLPPFEPCITNITATDVPGAPWHGFWSQDTADIAYNPVSGRIEAVVTNRNGGGSGLEQKVKGMSLNLWSIGVDALLAGSATWRFEGTLIQRTGRMVDGLDGMHPGGAIIDTDNGVQHIFCYMGVGWQKYAQQNATGLSGIFRITRTLDTGALALHLKQSHHP